MNDQEDESLLITGLGPAGQVLTVSVSDNTTSIVTRLTVPSSGAWEVVLDISSLDEGSVTVEATSADGGKASAGIVHILAGPLVSIDRPVASDNVIDRSEDTNVIITGTAPAGSIVQVTLEDSADDTIVKTAVTSPAGVWSVLVDTSALNNGEITVTASTTDQNGNTGSDTVSVLQTPYGTRLDCDDLPAAHCGNRICDPAETISSCPGDCSVSKCGDDVCGPMENSLICPQDCVSCAVLATCGNTVCEEGENAGSCPTDCAALPPCGNGVCDPEENAGSCASDCALQGGMTCGDGFCDDQENGGNCPQDCARDNPLSCRNGVCDLMENAGNCPEDCALSLCNKDGICDVFENSAVCSDCDASLCNNNNFCDLREHPTLCADCNNLPEMTIRTFNDANLNGVRDPSEELIEGAFLFVDLNRNGRFDSNAEPLFATSTLEDGDVAARLRMRAGVYDIGVIKSSLDGLAIGYVLNSGQEVFSVRLGAQQSQAVRMIPLSRNLRPEAANFKITAPSGRSAVNIAGVITADTDPNNNIDFDHGFEMLSFPDAMADWVFSNGTLTILPLRALTESFQVSYRLCDKERLCSDPAFIAVTVPMSTPAPLPLSPTDPAPPVVIVVTTPVPVPVPVPTPVRIYVFPDDNNLDDYDAYYSSTESGAASLTSLGGSLLFLFLSFILF